MHAKPSDMMPCDVCMPSYLLLHHAAAMAIRVNAPFSARLLLTCDVSSSLCAVNKGDRVAQLVLEKIATPEVVEVEDLDSSDRGHGGFGSTGVAAKH